MNSTFAVACFTVALSSSEFAGARVQEAPPLPTSQQPPTAKPPPADVPPHPPARKWHGSFNAGIGLASGAQAQRGFQLDLGLHRQLSERGRFVANLSRDYTNVTFPSESVLADRWSGATGVDYSVTKHTVAMTRALYLSDQPLLIDSRFEQLFGYGLHLFDAKKRYEFYFVPGVSVFKQDLTYSEVLDWEVGLGFFEKFAGKLNDAWSVEQSFRYRGNVTDNDQSIESVASMHGMITKTMGIQLEYQYNHESIVPDGYPGYVQTFSAGFRFQF